MQFATMPLRFLTISAPLMALFVLSNPAFAQLDTLNSEAEIRELFSGNKIMGMDKNENYVEDYYPDGRIEGRAEDERYTGEWRIQSGKICTKYEQETEWDCTKVARSGSTVYWLDEDFKSATLIPGNTR